MLATLPSPSQLPSHVVPTEHHDSVSHHTKQDNCIHSGRGEWYCILACTIISQINITPFDVSNYVEFCYGASWSTTEKMKVCTSVT